MATSVQEIQSFQEYAVRRIMNGGEQLDLEDLFLEWQNLEPSPSQLASDVAAIKLALDDYEAGDRGEPADKVIRELKAKYGASS